MYVLYELLPHFPRISSRTAAWSMPPRTCRYAHPLFTASAPTDWPRQRRSGSFPSACTGLRWFELTTPFHDETECHFLSRCSCHGSVVLLHPEISLLPTLPSYYKVHDRQTERYLLVYHQNVEKFLWIYITGLIELWQSTYTW